MGFILIILLFVLTEQRTKHKHHLPKNFSWHDVDGVNYLTTNIHQSVDKYCGSCWAVSTASHLSDRIKIMRKAWFPDIVISPQVLLSCNTEYQRGCKGGNSRSALSYIKNHGITDESCLQYVGSEVSCESRCVSCRPGLGCWREKKQKIFQIQDFYPVFDFRSQRKTHQLMKLEIQKNGPIVCMMHINDQIRAYTDGVMIPTSKGPFNHYITIIGWGIQNNTKYWIIKNTQGNYWGDMGLLRLSIKHGQIGGCYAATPKDTWSEKNKTAKYNFPKVYKWWLSLFLKNGCIRIYEERIGKTININQRYPSKFTWGKNKHRNILTPIIQYYNPLQCGACWSIGAITALSDRINIYRQNVYPQISLHHLAPCVNGDCQKNSPFEVYSYSQQYGLIEDGCSPYLGSVDLQKNKTCTLCFMTGCRQIFNFRKWNVTKYGVLKGSKEMKYQIMKFGPITCGIMVTHKFQLYQTGIYAQSVYYPFLTHEVVVIGWKYSKRFKFEYWIAKNSWGTSWGENGYFRIKMHEDNLGIEKQCHWGYPQQI